MHQSKRHKNTKRNHDQKRTEALYKADGRSRQMRVRITKARRTTFWYADFIGTIFEVFEKDGNYILENDRGKDMVRCIAKADAEVVPDVPSEEMMDRMIDVFTEAGIEGTKAAWRRLFQPEETAAERAKRLWKELCDNQLTDNKVPEKLWNKIAEHQYCMFLAIQEASKGKWTADEIACEYAKWVEAKKIADNNFVNILAFPNWIENRRRGEELRREQERKG
jgi:hypothetical protein